jgi:hypothetical protein
MNGYFPLQKRDKLRGRQGVEFNTPVLQKFDLLLRHAVSAQCLYPRIPIWDLVGFRFDPLYVFQSESDIDDWYSLVNL